MSQEQESPQVNSTGGTPPPGWGIHPDEAHFWDQPRYRVHPLTGKLEAVSGIFKRLWPEHVNILRQMKMDGWEQEEIAIVGLELKQRQDQEYQAHEEIILAAKQQRMAQYEDDVAAAHGVGVTPDDPAMPPGVEEEMPPDGEEEMPPEDIGKSQSLIDWLGPFNLEKADVTSDTSGTRTLSRNEKNISDEQSFSRKDQGVSNTPATGVQTTEPLPSVENPQTSAAYPPVV